MEKTHPDPLETLRAPDGVLRERRTDSDHAGLRARIEPWAPYCDCEAPRIDTVSIKLRDSWPEPRRLEFCCACDRPTEAQHEALAAEDEQRAAALVPVVERCLEALANVAKRIGAVVGVKSFTAPLLPIAYMGRGR